MIETAIELSVAQRNVVNHPLRKPGVVDAGAGTGKTFTIVERVAALHASGVCPADKILLLTFARKAAAELRARIARRLGEVTPHCSTFHAFAWSILSAHAYDIGLPPETEIIEDVEARVEFRKAFDDFLTDPRASSSGFPLRTFNRDEIRDGLFAINQDLKQRGLSIEAFRARALTAADAFGRIGYREIRSYYKRKTRGQDYKVLTGIDDERLAQEVREEKQRLGASSDIFTRFDQRLAARSVLTYADILVRAEAALRKNPVLREQLRERYRCCIVDEYQDTDLAQHRFLEALFGSDFACVMVVGDVLQSIYGFRGAHPENVRAFKAAPQSVAYPLVENRRSRQEILDLAHHAVLPAHAQAQHLVGQRGHANEQIVHVSSLWIEARTNSRHYIPADEARKLEADVVARRVSRLLASGTLVELGGVGEPIAPKHIAILSRTKMNVQPVTDALLVARVPFRLVGGVGFYDAPEIRDVLAWLRLLADPFDAHAVARALASPAIGASDAVLVQLARDLRADETGFARRVLVEQIDDGDALGAEARQAAEKLRGLLDELAPHAALPLIGALRALLEHTGIERFHHASSDARAAQALANLARLEALARGFAQKTPGAQPADFVSFIDELERVDYDEREADVPSYDAVTISTIHAAKGLEWPYVFVLGVWPRALKRPRLFVDERSSALLYAEGPDGSRSFHYDIVKHGADESGVVSDKSDDEKAEDEAEERRLFYVAITRARDRVFISGLRGKPSQQNPDGSAHRFLEDAYAWLRARQWESDEEVSGHAPLPELSRGARGMPATVRPTQPAQVSVRETVLAVPLSYSLIAGYEQCPRRINYRLMLRLPEVGGVQRLRARGRHVDEALSAEDLSAADSLLSAGEYGQVLHKALELWALEKRAGASSRSPAVYVSAAAQVLELSPARKQTESAVRAMEQIVRELWAWKPVQVEAPFTLDFGDEGKPLLVSGYLDLLALDGEGHACLVDYKTGDARVDHALQLALYRAAARQVYGMDGARCLIGRVEDNRFSLEPVEPVSDGELQQRIARVRDGLVAREDRPIAGAWCATCGYRRAPCQDYARGK